MGKIFEQLDRSLREFITAQKMFFVGTAPLAADGLVNLSPKGLDSFRILGDREVAYIDLYGSGIETVAHVKENGRLVIMFCAFEGPPRILRLHGQARAVERRDDDYAQLAEAFPDYPSARAIIQLEVTRIADSCGFSVPLYEYQEQRETLLRSAERKGKEGLRASQLEKNMKSLDGLPGLREPSV